MMPGGTDTSAELELSRKISQLSQQCAQEQQAIDAERLAALVALPGARAAVDQRSRELDDAQAAHDAAVQKARDDRLKNVQNGGDARSEEHRKAEAEWRQADAAADDDRAADGAKALADYRNRLKEIDKLPPPDQSRQRSDAEAAYKRALENADRALAQALEGNRSAMQARREKALAEELADDEQAATDEARAMTAAASAQQAATDRADAKMMRTLEHVAGALDIVADFDARRAAKKRDCEDRMNALFEEYRNRKPLPNS